jgi:Ras-related protein Rab-8A
MLSSDIRNWHANVGQHASEGVNKILIGNKSDWTDKRAVTEDQGRALAEELDMKFMETSAKANEGVEEAFFALARFVALHCICDFELNFQLYRDCKARLIDSQADAAASPGGLSNVDGSVKVNQPATSASTGCCS